VRDSGNMANGAGMVLLSKTVKMTTMNSIGEGISVGQEGQVVTIATAVTGDDGAAWKPRFPPAVFDEAVCRYGQAGGGQ
jgi:H+/Cl- antiporter ClcA